MQPNYTFDSNGMYVGTGRENQVLEAVAATRPAFRDAMNEYQASYYEVIGDAGRYWQQCEYTRETLQMINCEIMDLFRQAEGVFADLAFDGD